MEVYLNVAETGIGTYGVNAGAQRYFNHDASTMSRVEAARIAAILPLPKKRGVVAPQGFTRRYGNSISARIGVVANEGMDACVYSGARTPPETPEPAPRPATKGPTRSRDLPRPAEPVTPEPLPGEEYEQPRAAPEPAAPPPALAPVPPPPPAPAAGNSATE